ncbi:protein N-lysine methyltransferase METTL21A-like isoform X1 [Hibiscus syriacus]|uniref:protein N-lysine methyltransferase METTL21A-like isoform X1 n=1 Tax=Hibiscus syriacus TaxID=106335 RepID=UPI0019229C49|nr:protein N-lysine methyltransferase METTL21A-like isoform X1 [Hibiscus syriacus]
MVKQEEEDDDIVCLDASFFINDNYQLTTFTFGSHVLQLYCLQSASTDFDLTGQLVWPGAMLLNDFLSKNAELLQGCSMIELGSGVGITGMLCSRFCRQILLTDHNEEVLKILRRNIELNASAENPGFCSALEAEKLEWGNSDQINRILHRYPGGFDLILGADICFQQSSVPLLFDTVEQLLKNRGRGHCKFILAYVSRAKMMDLMVIAEATRHGMLINEVAGTRSVVGNLEGVIYEITLC